MYHLLNLLKGFRLPVADLHFAPFVLAVTSKC